MSRSVKQIHNIDRAFNLPLKLKPLPQKGVYKCRVSYSREIEKVEFEAYTPKEINSFKLVESDIDYSLKYADRSELLNLYRQRGAADEIIIVKNGLITDTSYSNLIFFNGNKWLTPKSPLLFGIQRERLLREGKIQEADITAADLVNFESVMVVNAMLWFDLERTVTFEEIS